MDHEAVNNAAVHGDLRSGHVSEFLAQGLPALSLDRQLVVTFATSAAARFFGTTEASLMGASLESLLQVSATWPWAPWATSETENAIFLQLIDEAIDFGIGHRMVNLLTESQMLYKMSITVTYHPPSEQFYMVMPICETASPARPELGITSVTNKGELKMSSGVVQSMNDVTLVRACCEEDSIEDLSHRIGLSRATVERRLRAICEKLGVSNIRRLINTLAGQMLGQTPNPSNTIRMMGCPPALDHLRYQNLPKAALPEEPMYLRMMETTPQQD